MTYKWVGSNSVERPAWGRTETSEEAVQKAREYMSRYETYDVNEYHNEGKYILQVDGWWHYPLTSPPGFAIPLRFGIEVVDEDFEYRATELIPMG